jgi:hypothetical protein
VKDKVPSSCRGVRVAQRNRQAAMARLAPILASLCIAAAARATPPLTKIDVTPHNENSYPFSVVLSGRGESRKMIVIAPRKIGPDCAPRFGAEVRARDGKLIYAQMMNFGPATEGHEIRGEIVDPANSLTLWVNYCCPEAHWRDSARYTLSSVEWEKSGRIR